MGRGLSVSTVRHGAFSARSGRMYLNRRPNHTSTRGIAALVMAVLLGAPVAPRVLEAQAPPFTAPLPMCYAPPSPETDGWPVAVADDLGSTPAAPVTFARAVLSANDIGTGLVVTSVDAVTSNGGHVTGSDPLTYSPPIPFAGTDTFAYEVTDAAGQTAIGIVRITNGPDTVDPNVSITSPANGGGGFRNVTVPAAAPRHAGGTTPALFAAGSHVGGGRGGAPVPVR